MCRPAVPMGAWCGPPSPMPMMGPMPSDVAGPSMGMMCGPMMGPRPVNMMAGLGPRMAGDWGGQPWGAYRLPQGHRCGQPPGMWSDGVEEDGSEECGSQQWSRDPSPRREKARDGDGPKTRSRSTEDSTQSSELRDSFRKRTVFDPGLDHGTKPSRGSRSEPRRAAYSPAGSVRDDKDSPGKGSSGKRIRDTESWHVRTTAYRWKYDERYRRGVLKRAVAVKRSTVAKNKRTDSQAHHDEFRNEKAMKVMISKRSRETSKQEVYPVNDRGRERLPAGTEPAGGYPPSRLSARRRSECHAPGPVRGSPPADRFPRAYAPVTRKRPRTFSPSDQRRLGRVDRASRSVSPVGSSSSQRSDELPPRQLVNRNRSECGSEMNEKTKRSESPKPKVVLKETANPCQESTCSILIVDRTPPQTEISDNGDRPKTCDANAAAEIKTTDELRRHPADPRKAQPRRESLEEAGPTTGQSGPDTKPATANNSPPSEPAAASNERANASLGEQPQIDPPTAVTVEAPSLSAVDPAEQEVPEDEPLDRLLERARHLVAARLPQGLTPAASNETTNSEDEETDEIPASQFESSELAEDKESADWPLRCERYPFIQYSFLSISRRISGHFHVSLRSALILSNFARVHL